MNVANAMWCNDVTIWQKCPSVCLDVRGMGVVAGAVVGVSFGVLLLILIIWLVFRKKEKKKYEEEETPNEIRWDLSIDCVFTAQLSLLILPRAVTLTRLLHMFRMEHMLHIVFRTIFIIHQTADIRPIVTELYCLCSHE